MSGPVFIFFNDDVFSNTLMYTRMLMTELLWNYYLRLIYVYNEVLVCDFF